MPHADGGTIADGSSDSIQHSSLPSNWICDPPEEYVTIPDLTEYIRTKKSGVDSTEDLVKLSRCMFREGLLPSNDDDLKRTELEDEFSRYLDTSISTCLHHLLDIHIVQRDYQGPETLIIHERRDEIVNGEDLEALVSDEIDLMIADMKADDPPHSSHETSAVADGGETDESGEEGDHVIRDVLAEEFEKDPSKVETHLRTGDVLDRRTKLEDGVDAIEADDSISKGRDYGRILFIRNPYRYELTDRAMSLISK